MNRVVPRPAVALPLARLAFTIKAEVIHERQQRQGVTGAGRLSARSFRDVMGVC